MVDPSSDSLQPDQFLTADESAEVDRALMTARERFSTRVAIYALRSLKQVAQQQETTIDQLGEAAVVNWVEQDPSLQADNGFDPGFRRFFARLVLSSLRPLNQIAQQYQVAIDQLTVAQVVAWFEQEAKRRVEQE